MGAAVGDRCKVLELAVSPHHSGTAVVLVLEWPEGDGLYDVRQISGSEARELVSRLRTDPQGDFTVRGRQIGRGFWLEAAARKRYRTATPGYLTLWPLPGAEGAQPPAPSSQAQDVADRYASGEDDRAFRARLRARFGGGQ